MNLAVAVLSTTLLSVVANFRVFRSLFSSLSVRAQVGQGSFSRVRLAHVRAAKRTLSPREVLEGEEAPDDVPFALKIMRKFDICVQKQVTRRLLSRASIFNKW